MSQDQRKPRSTNELRELLDSLNLLPEEKDTLYRILWEPYVAEDVTGLLDEPYQPITDAVVKAYVWDTNYDCELPYWDNLKSLVEQAIDAM